MMPDETFRFATLNILNNPKSYEARLISLVEELKIIQPDVMALQEVIEHPRELLENALKKIGYSYFYYGDTVSVNNSVKFGNAIVSKIPAAEASVLNFSDIKNRLQATSVEKHIAQAIDIPYARFSFNGKDVYVMSAHFPWGSKAESHRAEVAQAVSQKAEQLAGSISTPVILGGDFNALETSKTLRILKGLEPAHNGESYLWVDAWEMFGNSENYVTSSGELYWAKETAKNHNNVVKPLLLPKRRIDYIFSHGWVYGKTGSPLNFNRFVTLHGNENEISDHYGLWSDIYLG